MRVCVTVIIRSCDNKKGVALYEKMLSPHHMGRSGDSLFKLDRNKDLLQRFVSLTHVSGILSPWFKLSSNCMVLCMSGLYLHCFNNMLISITD